MRSNSYALCEIFLGATALMYPLVKIVAKHAAPGGPIVGHVIAPDIQIMPDSLLPQYLRQTSGRTWILIIPLPGENVDITLGAKNVQGSLFI